MSTADICVFIDPPSHHFSNNQLFNADNPVLNRDGSLIPYIRIKKMLMTAGVEIYTADLLMNNKHRAKKNLYWTTGIMDNYRALAEQSDVELCGAILFEPPLVAPAMYAELPELTQHFSSVYVHNIFGDGYSLKNVDTHKLKKLYWPQPYESIINDAWENTVRSNKLVVIAGNHNPLGRKPEYYSKRIEAIAALSKHDAVDLFGRGWTRWLSRQSLWAPYWLNLPSILNAYRGACESKVEVLKNYNFCICFENFPMTGYVTEKIFDCLYAGTIPVYLGAPNIADLIPDDCYIKVNEKSDWSKLHAQLNALPLSEILRMKLAGRRFIESTEFKQRYIDFLGAEFVGRAK